MRRIARFASTAFFAFSLAVGLLAVAVGQAQGSPMIAQCPWTLDPVVGWVCKSRPCGILQSCKRTDWFDQNGNYVGSTCGCG